ncbi:MAG: hypothetical protein BWY57_02472 [Betaproteobacteria bacterium ADurb.Bin341]|nr:MAG: hypothetical protein BWY57_02472 [Betaproteobacteria bacterium ADurb.Bin341]
MQDDLLKIAGNELIGIEVENIDVALRVVQHLAEISDGSAFRFVERDDAGVIVVGTVDGAGAEAKNQAYHAGCRVDALLPDIRIDRQPDPGQLRIEKSAIMAAGDALYQQGHLFVAVEQATLGAVA